MLFSFPRTVVLSLFKNWLALEELTVFDAAICNVQTRQLFLNCLEFSEFSFTTCNHNENNHKFLFWAWSRGIIVSSLFLGDGVVQLLKNTANAEKLHKVANLKVRCDKQFKSFQILIEKCTNLRRLEIMQSSGRNVDKVNNGNWLIPIFKCLKDIHFLGLTNVLSLSIKNVKVLSDTCTFLQELSVDTSNLSENGLEMILKANRNITKIALRNSIFISSTAFAIIAEHCPNIEDLELMFDYAFMGCLKVVENKTFHFSNMKHLRRLKTNFLHIFKHLQGCNALTELYVKWVSVVKEENSALVDGYDGLIYISKLTIEREIHYNYLLSDWRTALQLTIIPTYINITELNLVRMQFSQALFENILFCCEKINHISLDTCVMFDTSLIYTVLEGKRVELQSLTFISCVYTLFDDVINVCKVYFERIAVVDIHKPFTTTFKRCKIQYNESNLEYLSKSVVIYGQEETETKL